MTFCPNPNSEVFKRLEAAVGKNKSYYYWNQFEGNPTEADLVDLENSNLNDEVETKSGVLELFESNPELANAVYEALGVEIKNFKLIPNNEKHPEDANTYDVIYNDEKK